MKALQLIQTGRPLEEREVPVPVPERGEVVVKVVAAGICHSDAHYRAGTSPAFATATPLACRRWVLF